LFHDRLSSVCHCCCQFALYLSCKYDLSYQETNKVAKSREKDDDSVPRLVEKVGQTKKP